MTSVFDVLESRGFIAQTTHLKPIKELLSKEKTTFYIGFDATADSLHVGHFIQVMVMMHMQQYGHRPIVLIGGGTTMVGDPTGKTDMRKMLTKEEIQKNSENFKHQLSKFIDFKEDKAIMLDNADWLLQLKYIEFLRDIGIYFSVNRMLTAECFKTRLEKGLSFTEFNYMLMQSYDYLKLYQKYNCTLQLGGDDQWSNIIGGIDLIRRVEGQQVYGMTFNLLTTSEGKKMGKTEKGALWLDAEKTSPYEFYQYWRNVHDEDVVNCLKLLTFLPIEEIGDLEQLEGHEINKAKQVLAFEVTKLVHGEKEAIKAEQAARALFNQGKHAENMPSTIMSEKDISEGLNILQLLQITKLTSSKGEGRRLISQGGLYVNDKRIEDIDFTINIKDFTNKELMIRKGKKSYHKIELN